MDHKNSGHSSRNRSKSSGNEGERMFPRKTEPEVALSLAQKFLNFFGFGKPPKPNKPAPKRSGKRDIQKHPVSNERLFVGNLSYDVKEEELAELFEKAGKVVKAEIVTNRQTRRSKGFGFVTMGSVEDAERAVNQLDGSSLSDREISVSGAKSDGQKDDRPRRDRAPRERSGDDSRRGEPRQRAERSDTRERGDTRERSTGRRESEREGDGDRRRDGRGKGRGKKSAPGPTVFPMAVEEVSTPLLSMCNLAPEFGETELEHLFAGVAKISSSQISDGKADLEMATVEDAQTAIRLLHGKDFMGQTLSLSGKASA